MPDVAPVMTTALPRMIGFDICLSDGPQKIPRLRAPLQRCPRDTFARSLGIKTVFPAKNIKEKSDFR
jgi:hypothetical protein